MENTSEKRGGYYAVLPANVRYDKSLNAQCKLLYAELTALASACGYCWARNGYFAELYGVDEATVSRWLKKLSDKQYIKLERMRKTDGTYRSRKIYIVEASDGVVESDENDHMTKMQCGSESGENVHMTKMQCGSESGENDHMTKMQCGSENGENDHMTKMQCGQNSGGDHIAKLQNSHIAILQDNNNIFSKVDKKYITPSNEGECTHARARSKRKRSRSEPKFEPPTLEEVVAYCTERHNSVDARRFYDFYESNGWRVGKNDMRDWQAALRRWESDDRGGNVACNNVTVNERFTAEELNALINYIDEEEAI